MKNNAIIFLGALLLFLSFTTNAQIILSGDELLDLERVRNAEKVHAKIIDGDTNLYIFVRNVVILPPMKFKNKRQRRKYDRLAYHIKKVYPYAVEIRNTYAEIEDDISIFETRRERKAFLKKKEKELRKEFEQDLINLTFYQGRLLIKLVDRETGSTSFEVIKEFKGGMSAFFWQSVAVMFGANLKSQFDTEEDKMIEDIIVRIENGQL